MTNSVDPDQTAPIGAVCSGSTLFASVLNSSVRQLFAADDFSRRQFPMHFSWRFKPLRGDTRSLTGGLYGVSQSEIGCLIHVTVEIFLSDNNIIREKHVSIKQRQTLIFVT